MTSRLGEVIRYVNDIFRVAKNASLISLISQVAALIAHEYTEVAAKQHGITLFRVCDPAF